MVFILWLLDKEAVDEFLKTLPSPKPMVSRENFFKEPYDTFSTFIQYDSYCMTHTKWVPCIIRNQNLQAQAKKPEITEAEELDEDSIDESGSWNIICPLEKLSI